MSVTTCVYKSAAEKAEEDLATAHLEKAAFGQQVSYHLDMDSLLASDKPFRFLMGRNKNIRYTENEIGKFLGEVSGPVLGMVDPPLGMLEFKLPKIDFSLFVATVQFFWEVMKQRSNAEAMLQYYYKKSENTYYAVCPIQTVSGASVKFTRAEEFETDPDYVLVMDIHSHNTMGAFFSGVDDADEKETRIYGVFGNLDKEVPAGKFRVIVNDTEQMIAISDIFESPLDCDTAAWTNTLTPDQIFSVYVSNVSREYDPETYQEWVDICQVPTYSTHTTYGTGTRARRQYGAYDWSRGDMDEAAYAYGYGAYGGYWDDAYTGDYYAGVRRRFNAAADARTKKFFADQAARFDSAMAEDGDTKERKRLQYGISNKNEDLFGPVERVRILLDEMSIMERDTLFRGLLTDYSIDLAQAICDTNCLAEVIDEVSKMQTTLLY